MTARVGWLGLGAMGAPMARAAARAGHPVTAFDVVASRAAALEAEGVRPVESAAAVAADADVLVLMVATPEQGEAALFASGAAAALPPGAVVLLMSTVGPGAARRWAERLGDVALVDAPVSGGVRRAGDGELLVMMSGAAEPLARVEPLVAALASSAPVVGSEVGAGQKVKLVNQLLCGVHVAVAAEALAFAEALGLDARASWEVVRGGAAASFMLENRGERMLRGEFADVASALDIFVKDLGLVRNAASASGYVSPLADTAAALFAAGHEAGLGNLDDAALIEVLRRQDTGG